MASEKIDLRPYRTALEALISYHRPVKLSQMLGSAAANLEDPELRKILKDYIDALPMRGFESNEPLRIADNHRFRESAATTIDYIEQVIDAREFSWEILAESYGWTPPKE